MPKPNKGLKLFDCHLYADSKALTSSLSFIYSKKKKKKKKKFHCVFLGQAEFVGPTG